MTANLAQRIYDLDPYEARNCYATPETIAEDIKKYPEAVIGYLLDQIDDLWDSLNALQDLRKTDNEIKDSVIETLRNERRTA